MKHKKKIFSSLLLIALAGVGWAAIGNDENGNDYRTTTISRGDIAEVVTANGTLKPEELIQVGTQASGKIERIHVKLNDVVKKGQLLAEIDPSLAETQLRQSNSNLETSRNAFRLAQRNLARTRTLYKKQYVAKVELEREEQAFLSAKNAYASAKTQVERDEVNLSYTKILSPIDGVIVSQEVSQGQTMAANFQTPNLFSIASDLKTMKINVNFSEADISKVKEELPVSFNVDAFPDREFDGIVKIVNINPESQSGIVTYSVTVSVDNKERLLLPGMTAFVRVILSERKNILRVPAAALRFRLPEKKASGLSSLFNPKMRKRYSPRNLNKSKSSTIHIIKNDEPIPVEVEVGSTDETFVEISGATIKEGDIVVIGLAPRRRR